MSVEVGGRVRYGLATSKHPGQSRRSRKEQIIHHISTGAGGSSVCRMVVDLRIVAVASQGASLETSPAEACMNTIESANTNQHAGDSTITRSVRHLKPAFAMVK